MSSRAHQGYYGIDPRQEHQKEEIIRDIRPMGKQLSDAIMEREGFAFAGGMCAVAMLVEPALFLVLLPIFALLAWIRSRNVARDVLPMRVPQSWGKTDYADVNAAGGYKKARGMFYIGNEMSKNRELWIAKDDILTHMLILGTTGAGKTETLISLSFNYFSVGSGLLYVDPKAAPKLGAQIYTMCRIMGRDDDFLLLSYMSDKMAQESMKSKGHSRVPSRQSNTQNPFAVGTANQLTQLLFALMPADNGGGNAIFANNAQTLISGLMFVLVEMRDKGEAPLSIGLIRKYLMDINEIDALARRDQDFSELSIAALQSGLATCGWNKSAKSMKEQPKSFPEQYGYARAYFGRALSLLVDNYGRIFKTTHGEVDAVDVITSRRVYATLIPSMDKDPKELKNLGQICLSSVRNACAVGLGDKIQGRLSDVLGALPTDARTPFGVIVDEYAAIETPGFEILLTQGRGLGIAVMVASQDFAGIKRASEAAAEQIVSNCKVKIFMCQEDPRQTFDLIKAIAGESLVYKTSGYGIDKQNNGTRYLDNQSVSLERMSRVDFRDLQKQVEGQITAFFKGEMIRGKTFYAAPPLKMTQEVRLAYHLKVQQPDIQALRQTMGDIAALNRAARALLSKQDARVLFPGGLRDSGLLSIARLLDGMEQDVKSLPENTVLAFCGMEYGQDDPDDEDDYPEASEYANGDVPEEDGRILADGRRNEIDEAAADIDDACGHDHRRHAGSLSNGLRNAERDMGRDMRLSHPDPSSAGWGRASRCGSELLSKFGGKHGDEDAE